VKHCPYFGINGEHDAPTLLMHLKKLKTTYQLIIWRMKKLSVKKLIEFRNKSNRAKKTFVENIKSNKVEVNTEGGGDYWITGLSGVCNSFKERNLDIIDEKINELQKKISNTGRTNSKHMYQRNIAILQNYKSTDLKKLSPVGKLQFLKKSTANRLLTIKGLEIETKPSQIYLFGKKGEEKVGAIWFATKKDGYRIEEVGMFCDMLFRFLRHNYFRKYQLIPKYCVAMDLLSGNVVDYSQMEVGGLSQILSPTLDEINKLM